MKQNRAMAGYWILPRWLTRRISRVSLLFLCLIAHVPGAIAATPVTDGAWLMESKVALRFFDCGDRLCGRIVWLVTPRDEQGVLQHDSRNPDTALRERPLCGLTILWALRAKGADRWKDGWFYNPFDGNTYRVSAKLESPDLIVARIYRGIPLFGETRKLQRVPHDTEEGWC